MKMTEISKLLKLPISGIWRRIRNKEFPTYEIKVEKGYLLWNKKDVLNWKKENEKARKKNKN